MLQITIPECEFFDEGTETFVHMDEKTIQLEHSLVSLSKWESKWHKPFLGREPKTEEETIDYVRCMTITHNVSPLIYQRLTPEHYKQINDYIEDSMTATWFSKDSNSRSSREVVTAEIIYFWMVTYGIPFECEKWHLNRLLTLIRVCDRKNAPSKKMSKAEQYRQNRALNAARRSKLHSRG